ncbi:beta-lactamase hydrolase domain-containing protein [Nevskia soli]|uniref:beta-lactamase hydrolase domain-containing protein n=1 Tax=Nevskia soli TaxID=418856 RepID=UPI00068CB097|nr:sulfur transferase domain-containing protein [Nevskia soli]
MSSQIWIDVPNACTPAEGLCTGGRPRPEHLEQARQRGVKMIVNLCPPSEPSDYDEAAVVRSLGMVYVNIPVAGPADLTPANARKLATALSDAEAGPVLVHCASGNRVGALFALKAHFVDGLPIEEAVNAGRAAGLKILEPAVRNILAGH